MNLLEIKYWLVAELIPYARNPRKNDEAVDRMVASIREFGFKVPLLIRSNGDIVDGHLRLKASQKLGMTEVPVILCDDWSEAQVKAFRLLVNRSVTWAEWDEELVALELEELKDLDFDLQLTGFDPVEIDNFLVDESEEQSADAVEEVPETRSRELATCGAAANTACSVAIRPAPRLSRGCSATVSRG